MRTLCSLPLLFLFSFLACGGDETVGPPQGFNDLPPGTTTTVATPTTPQTAANNGNAQQVPYTPQVSDPAETCDCPPQGEQVCGVDGKTYAGACQAACVQIDVAARGACQTATTTSPATTAPTVPAATTPAQGATQDDLTTALGGLLGGGDTAGGAGDLGGLLEQFLGEEDGTGEGVDLDALMEQFGDASVDLSELGLEDEDDLAGFFGN